MKDRAVVGVVWNSDKILAVSRRDDHEDFGLPGGKLDPGESPYDALVRELREETGIEVTRARHIYTRRDWDRLLGEIDVMCYLIEEYVGPPVQQPNEGVVAWVDLSRITSSRNAFGNYNSDLARHMGWSV